MAIDNLDVFDLSTSEEIGPHIQIDFDPEKVQTREKLADILNLSNVGDLEKIPMDKVSDYTREFYTAVNPGRNFSQSPSEK